ncbi:hypothetical protein [Rhodococcus koreensis]|uniref:hypothetical protein n=1 Tax=Rhodococcus koreensis TaxID=99653 RepID=UPI000A4FB455|nr:hypothetical protein [Rhodococcus koreensis]
MMCGRGVGRYRRATSADQTYSTTVNPFTTDSVRRALFAPSALLFRSWLHQI